LAVVLLADALLDGTLLVVAIGLELIAGFDTTHFVTASLVGFVVCQALFGLLLYVRRHD
jgi:hypothetical protein